MRDRHAPPNPGQRGNAAEPIGEVLQEVPEHPYAMDVVPVEVQGPVNVSELPSQTSSARSLQITNAEEILPGDPRRNRALLLCALQGAIVGPDKTQVTQGIGFLIPVNVPIPIATRSQLYARTADPTLVLPTVLSVMVESGY